MIIIPAAGEGRRFREAGYKEEKPYIPLAGKAMVERVVENVLWMEMTDNAGEVKIIVATQSLIGKTKGAVDTILKVLDFYEVGHGESLIVANCDQLLDFPADAWRALAQPGNGLVYGFGSTSSAHSYVTFDKTSKITSIIEKPEQPPIGSLAVSGVYYFPRPDPFIEACRYVRSSGGDEEQYISSALAVMISEGYGLYAENVPTAILGTPEDFTRFETALKIARDLL